jgi:hypothetical protein
VLGGDALHLDLEEGPRRGRLHARSHRPAATIQAFLDSDGVRT